MSDFTNPSSTIAPALGVLAGLRVLDFSSMIAGPYCTRWLADLGAEIVKVEPPEGDHMRHRPPLREGSSSFYGHFNTGKRCIALDLKQPAAVEVARSLASHADVVVEAFRPGVMKRLGLGADELRQHNPRLIYCSISGFGQSTDASARPAYAPVVHASSGYYMAMAEAQEGPLMPPNSSVPMADMLTAIFAAMAIQTALLQRQRTGVGTTIDVNLMDSVMSVMAFEFQAAQFPTTHARPHYKPLRALDGHLLVTPINARNFRNLCTATGHPEWIDDPLLATDATRFKNWSEYMRRIEAWTCVRTASECEAILLAHGVPCSPYRRIEEAMRDPQFEQRHSFSRVSDAAGEFLTTNLPFSLAGHRPSASGKVGSIGADTAAVLKDMLGLSDDQIAGLARTGAAICP